MKVNQDESYQYISLYQKEKRITNIPYSSCKILIGKLTENGLEFIVGSHNQEKVLMVESIFEKGEYLIYIDITWLQENYTDLTLSNNFSI